MSNIDLHCAIPAGCPFKNRRGKRFSSRSLKAILGGLAALGAMVGINAGAGNVYLRVNDALGTSSITGSTNWNPTGVPAAGNIYFTTNTAGLGLQMRTPTGLSSNVFAGDALVLCTNQPAGTSLLMKGDQGSTIVINNLIMAGGGVGNGGNSAAVNTTNMLAGNINVVAPSRFDSGGVGRALVVASAITNGTSTLTCTNLGSVWLFGTNYGYTGKILVSGTNTTANACTLQITNQFNLGGNPATFTPDQLTLNAGVLQVTNNVTLDDANRGITIGINGGKFDVAAGATLTLPNPITGAGAVTKNSAGTLVLSGANTLSNAFTINAGIVVVQNSNGLGTNGGVTSTSRNGGIQLQGNVSIPAAVNFTLSNDGTGASPAIPYAIDSLSGNNVINGTVTVTTGGGSALIQSDSGSLTIAGTMRIATGQSSRGFILQGASTGANTISGAITNGNTGANSITKNDVGYWTLSGTNLYTGPTIVNGGTLYLSGNGSISNSAFISVATGATFDVSGLVSPFTLNVGQSISNSTGTVKGSVVTAAGSSIYPATPGVAGTLTFNGNLNLNAGGTVFFDLDTTASGANDQVAVGGNLTLSSSDYVHINATSGVLDTADYVLFSVGTGTSMATTPILVWDGSVPANNLNYSLVKTGNNVVLHYSSSTAPSVTATATPNPATRNQAVTVTATVTQGTALIAGVTVDLTAVGGSPTAGLVLNSAASTPPTFVYTNTFTVTPGTGVGNTALTVTAADATSPAPLTGTYIINPLTIAATVATWDGGAADNKWSSNINWTSDIGPGLVGDAIDFTGSTRLTPDLDTNYSVSSVTFDGSAGAFTLVSSTGNTLTSGSGGIINNSALAQTVNVPLNLSAAQTFNAAVGNLVLNTNVTLGANTLTVDGAATTTISGLVSGTAGIQKNGGGILVLPNANNYGNNGGADTSINAGILAVGNDAALGTSRLNFADGATIESMDSTAHTITNNLNFGSGAGGNTTFAGTGNLKFTKGASNSSSKVMTVNNPVTEFSGGLSGTMARTVAGTGLLIFSGANSYSQGTTINGGATLQLGNGSTNGTLSTSGVIDVEGTLIFNRSDAIVQGTHFSTAPIIGGGAVIQAGAGTTTLNAANTYSGLTTVNSGELFITQLFQGGGGVTVANGANFGISASSVTNSASIGNLTLGTGGATLLDFSFGFGGNPTNAAIAANNVVVNGTSTIRIGGSFTTGTFPVLKYNSLSGSFVSSVVGPRGVTATVQNDTVNKQINVVISSVGGGIVWTGTNSVAPNLWDLNITTNWLIGGLPTVYLESVPPGDAVIFNDLGSGTVLLSNTASPANVTISNTAVAYTIQGSGQISSAAGLTKVGTGTLTLNVPGTFASKTVISNSTISIGANQSFANLSGNGAVTIAAGAPTLTLNNTANSTFAGSIAGATLTKTGNSILTLTGTNTLTGNLFAKAGAVTVDSGTINLTSYCSVGLSGTDSGALTLKGNAVFNGNNDLNAGDTGSAVGIINIQDNAVVTVNGLYVGSANATGSTASGTVNQTGGTVTQFNATAGTFTVGGRTDVTSVGGVGVYNLSGGLLICSNSIRVGGSGNGTFNQSGGTVICNPSVNISRLANSIGVYNLDGGTLRVASVTSSTGANATFNMNGGVLAISQDGAVILTNLPTIYVRNGGAVIDTTNFNVSIYNTLQHSGIGGDNATDGGLTKRGNGMLTLADNYYSSYTGPTFVAGGTLSLYPNSIINLNSLMVSNAALNLNITGGAATFNAASVKFNGNNTLNLNYDVMASTPPTTLNVSGGLTVAGTTTINIFGYGWTAGQQIALVDYSGTPLANLSNFVLGALPYGVTANLSNNVANTSIDLVITAVSLTSWIPLLGTDPVGISSFNSSGLWQDGSAPSAGKGYLTRTFAVRSPADSNPYTFGGSALSVDVGGRFIMKGTGGQVMTVDNLILNGGLVDYANSGDNLTETLGGNITLQAGLTSYIGALGSGGASETLYVTATIGGSGNLQISGSPASNAGSDLGVVVLAATNSYTGNTTVATGTLLVNGHNGSSPITVNANATLGGNGLVGSTVNLLAGSTLAPGTPTRGALTAALGTLTANGTAAVSGAVVMKLNRDAITNSDQFGAAAITINPGATLTVNNLSTTPLAGGDTFTLFSGPVSGSFSTVTLPTLASTNLYWTNNLAVNGSISVVAPVTVNTSSTNVMATISGNTLTLAWPSDHKGWHLQVQTNGLSGGLGTNWITIPGSDTVTSTNIQINPANGSVFFRMVYP